jgi:16S rRNA (guanine966-N2)-methyltransferase
MRPKRKKSDTVRKPRNVNPLDMTNESRRAPKKRISPKPMRIIGGDLRRRIVVYNGDLQTRPMKDSVRENVFNILGKAINGMVAWDLFSGTGIIALEAISRGASRAIAIDLSRDCVRSIRHAAETLGVDQRVDVLIGDTFRIAPTRFQHTENERRVVFCCPPYRFWDEKNELMNQLILDAVATAAPGSLIVAETDNKFDPARLPEAEWDVRNYGNTRVAVMETD